MIFLGVFSGLLFGLSEGVITIVSQACKPAKLPSQFYASCRCLFNESGKAKIENRLNYICYHNDRV